MKLSIIVPVYKVEKYIRRCLDSIINQTFTDFELILVDDGSPDTSGEICEGYAKKDERIRVIHQENKGLSGARNTGVEVSKGEYIGFVDSDDWIELEMYEKLITAAEKYGADIVKCGLDYTDGNCHDRDNYGTGTQTFEGNLIEQFFQERSIF